MQDFLMGTAASSLIQNFQLRCTPETKIKILDEIPEQFSDWMILTARKVLDWDRLLWHPVSPMHDLGNCPIIGYPAGHEERKLFIQAQNDIYIEYYALTFAKNFSRKWAQKKYRQSKKNLRPINLHLRPDTHEEFMALKREYGLNKEDLLDKIIQEHYRTLFGVKE